MKIAFTGGGTGGHVFPALAVYSEIKKKNDSIQFFWIGSKNGIEKEIVCKHKIEYKAVKSGKLRRYFSFKNFLDIFSVFQGIIESFFILAKERPQILFSKGGFVSVPPVLAAKMLKINIIIHESDLSPGLATRIAAKFADTIILSYEETKKYFGKVKGRIEIAGNPIREEVLQGQAKNMKIKLNLNTEKKVLFIQGGSLGSEDINSFFIKNMDFLLESFFVIHQYGRAKNEIQSANKFEIKTEKEGEIKLYFKNELRYYAKPFFLEEYSDILALCDLSLARAGAGTLWELALSKTPAVLVPLKKGSRGDQVENAEYFKKTGAVMSFDISEEENIKNALDTMKKSEILKKMATCYDYIVKENPSKRIADLILGGYLEGNT